MKIKKNEIAGAESIYNITRDSIRSIKDGVDGNQQSLSINLHSLGVSVADVFIKNEGVSGLANTLILYRAQLYNLE